MGTLPYISESSEGRRNGDEFTQDSHTTHAELDNPLPETVFANPSQAPESPPFPLGECPSRAKLGIPEGKPRSEGSLRHGGPSSEEQGLQAQVLAWTDTARAELCASRPFCICLSRLTASGTLGPRPQRGPVLPKPTHGPITNHTLYFSTLSSQSGI